MSLSPGNPQMVDVVIKFLDKGTQVGSSFGKVDLPYEPGDKILIPRVGSKIMPSTSIAPRVFVLVLLVELMTFGKFMFLIRMWGA